jgi:hypothetical protein
MIWTKRLWIIGAVSLLALTIARAQTNVDSASSVIRSGTTVVPEKLTATDASTASNLRPPRPERTKFPPEVLDRIEKFKKEARTYLERQEALKKQLEGANDKERAMLRERIQQLREQWLDQAREFRKELRQRQQELIEKLPDYREVIESARTAAQQQLQQTQTESRTHRGED